MANKEHVAILEQGVEAWNQWRSDNPDIIDLSMADLRRANLRRANLRGADLCEADLREADLCEADLYGTYFVFTNLTESHWDFAKLDVRTRFYNPQFSSDHPIFNDGTDNLIIPGSLRFLQWSSIRAIGQFPLFGISWIGLITSLWLLNNLGWWNTSFI